MEGCSVSGRYSEKERTSISIKEKSIRVQLIEETNSVSLNLKTPILVADRNNRKIALIHFGNRLRFIAFDGGLMLRIQDKKYESKYFELIPGNNKNKITLNDRDYEGRIKIYNTGDNIQVINTLPIEEYLRGVVPAEMPVGNGDDNFSALKAFAICARTYAIMKINEDKPNYDVYADTRDQVYSGLKVENKKANMAINETKGMVLTYRDKPAIIFYHASCGGHTEKASDVFNVPDLPYLKGVKDGDPPNCSIAPNFSWQEIYTRPQFIQRLINSKLLSDESYTLTRVKILNRFSSGRVDNLEVTLRNSKDEIKTVIIHGNNIRNVIRTSDNKNILRSTMFDIRTDTNNNVIINGKGNGHGVGLCQWGAINLSRHGKSYKDILNFYFPGTKIMRYYD